MDRLYELDVKGKNMRGRNSLTRVIGVKNTNARSAELTDAKIKMWDRQKWRVYTDGVNGV